jgi:CMP-N-acetylneuraminic acid synthetase
LADKNIKALAGHPLIAYTIAAATQSGIFGSVIVSTDSQQYLEVVKHYGGEAPYLRHRMDSLHSRSPSRRRSQVRLFQHPAAN